MRGLFLILKNSLRNSFKNRFQLIGLTLLVALLALILSLMASINSRVIESYNFLKSSSNARNVVLQMDPFDQVETGDTPNSPAPKNLVEAQQYWLYDLQQQYYREENNLQFEWSRTEAREFSQVINQGNQLTLKTIAKITPKNVFNQNPVDRLVIFEGHDIRSDRQVVIDPIFASRQKIKIGDIIRIQQDNFGKELLVKSSKNENITEKLRHDVAEMEEKGLDDSIGIYQREYKNNYDWYQVVGFGGSADFMMPVLNKSSVLPNRKTELLVYVHPSAFGLEIAAGNNGSKKGLYVYNPNSDNGRRLTVSSNNEWESFYSLKLIDNHKPTSGEIQKMNRDFNQILKRNVGVKTYFYGANDPGYRYASRTLAIDQTITAYNIGSSILEILFAVVVLYSIGLVTRKQIEKIQGQIGTLKALGYYKRQLIFNFVMTPFFASFIGGIVGFAISGGLSGVVIKTFADYFLLNYGVAKFNWGGFILLILLLWLVLTGITFLIAFLVFRKDTVTLINARQISKASKFGRSFRQKRANATIGSKISSALLSDATGKMSVVGIVVLIATMVFTMSFAAPDILRRNQTASYAGVKYKQIVEYSDPVYNNPMSFYKTYNIEAQAFDPIDPDNIFKYSKTLNGFTSLPTLADENDDGYNVNRIMSDYANNNISNEFFSLFLKNGGTSDAPKPDLVTTNLRYLFGKDIASSTDYYRFMSSFGNKGSGFLDKILLNQWPDYNELMANLSDNNKTLIEIFDILQTFYSKYVNSIGLSITNDYYGEEIVPKDSDDQKIKSFNELDAPNGRSDPHKILANTKTEQGDNFNQELQGLTITDPFKFNFTDSNYKLGAFHITDGVHNLPNDINDYFLSLKGSELSETELKNNLITFIIWFGSLFSNRGDQGIIQAAYFRAPYFVQQFFKQAYFDKKPYVQGFGVVSYNQELEQLGTRLKVKSQKGNKFKIYGVQQSSSRFLDLKNRNSENLINDLYRSQEQNGIIINKSVAKILNLKTGDKVNLKVLQDELREKNPQDNEIRAVNLDKWNVTAPRDDADLKKGFTQLNNLGKSSLLQPPGILTKLTSSFNDSVSWQTAGSPLSPNDPSQLYNQVLQGNLFNEELETNVDFKVVGIHDGYGEPQAWIKENEAQQILKFDQVKKFAWNNWFIYQWGNEFTKDHQDLVTKFDFKGIAGLDFSEQKISYDDFIANYLNSSNPTIRKAARIVLQIFNNSFPIFNYKYSNKDDVGDLKNLVAIHQKFGDYSPIGMQGITANGRDIKKTYEGAGQGSIDMIVPVSISKAILKKISGLVLFVLILAIIAILLVTFVIIFLTTSLIIDDNVKFIATMKVLGYSNRYIASKVLGMYFIVIGSVFVVGFIAGWFIFAAIVQSLIPTIVLPLKFQIWLPFVVLMGVVGIYLITISVGFNSIARTNAVNILQNNDL